MNFAIAGRERADKTVTLPPLDLARSDILETLNLLFEEIQKTYPSIFQTFESLLLEKSKSLINDIKLLELNSDFSKEISEHKYLQNSVELVRSNITFLLKALNISESQLWENPKISYPAKEFLETIFHLFYTRLQILTQLIGREEAFSLYRDYVDNYNYRVNARNQSQIDENLEEFREKQIRWLENNPYGRVRIFGQVEDGRLIRFCANCEKFDTLYNAGFTDKEMLYHIICYMHITLANVWNKHFHLLLDSKAKSGKDYCTYIYLDRRISTNNDFPSREFLDDIWTKYVQGEIG